jgi:hypothetical protein
MRDIAFLLLFGGPDIQGLSGPHTDHRRMKAPVGGGGVAKEKKTTAAARQRRAIGLLEAGQERQENRLEP